MRAHSFVALLALLALTAPLTASLSAQENAVAEERGATEFNDSDIEQNVMQQAILKEGSGKRQLKLAQDLEKKIAAEADAKKRGKLEKKLTAARESAVADFREALGFQPKMVAAWAGLGTAYRAQGKYGEALQAYSEGSKLAPGDDACFTGWARTLLDGKMFGNLVAAHGQLTEGDPDRASELLGVARTWVEEHRAKPGDVDPADVERLAGWVAQQAE